MFGTTGGKGQEPGIYFARYDIDRKELIFKSSTALTAEMFITPGALDYAKGKPSLPRSSISILPVSTGYYVVMDAGTYSQNAGPNGASSVSVSMYNLNVLSINPEGKVNWIATVLRDHIGVVASGQIGAFGMSTSVLIKKDDFSLFQANGTMIGNTLTFIMNDDPDNIPQPKTSKELKPVRKPGQFSACIIQVAADGTITKEKVSPVSDSVLRWHPTYSISGRGYIYAFYDDGKNAGGAVLK